MTPGPPGSREVWLPQQGPGGDRDPLRAGETHRGGAQTMPASCLPAPLHAAAQGMGLLGFSWTLSLLLCALERPRALAVRVEAASPGLEPAGDSALLVGGRVKRGWVWNQFFVVEEYTGTEPLYVGKVK